MKKILICLLFTMVAMSIPTVTEASTWVMLMENFAGPLYIDTSSITTDSSGYKEVWFKQEYVPADCTSGSAKLIGKCTSRLVFYSRFYPDKRICNLQYTIYYTDETSKGPRTRSCDSNLCRVSPDSAGEAIWNFLFK